jgi:hypothetical protein
LSKHISQSPSSLKDPLKVSPEAFDWRNHSAVTDVKNQVNDCQRDVLFFGNEMFLFRVNVVHVGHLV